MPIHSPTHFLNYLLKREATQFFTSIAIRNLAWGMILIFEPIYIFLYFEKSLSSTLLFFAAVYGLFGVLVFFGGKAMSKFGTKHTILISNFIYFGYFLSLFFIAKFPFVFIIAIFLKAAGMSFFWPAFHTDFIRFSEKGSQGKSVGKMNVILTLPVVISPLVGGWILASFSYPVLFTIVLILLAVSAIPLFLSKENHQVYSDSFLGAWKRVFKKENMMTSIAFVSNNLEYGISLFLWPLFMFILAITYETMGGIVSFSLILAAAFSLYMGRLSDTVERSWFLNMGSVLLAVTWIIKYFVKTPLDALLAHTLYRICRVPAAIPFQTFMYEKAALKGSEADEFIIYREILINVSRSIFFVILAIVFFFYPQINIVFLMAAVFSLGFMLLGTPPKFKL